MFEAVTQWIKGKTVARLELSVRHLREFLTIFLAHIELTSDLDTLVRPSRGLTHEGHFNCLIDKGIRVS